MKVVSQSSEKLILANKPWLLGLGMILFVLIFVGIGLRMMMTTDEVFAGIMFALIGGGLGTIAFVAFVRRTQVILDAASDTITIRARSMLGFSERQHTLSDIDCAFLEAPKNSDSKGMYRPTLLMKPGITPPKVPILQVYTSGRGPKNATEAINDWLTYRARPPR